ncbi:COP9 CSN3 signalosome subunit 3 [Lecanosticta acicola]|uniref:COP9 CSN3 signalosome subunit 3 n=1 Tax=Lecanosticta acicola TaxID=111012 RepID=A0AAI8Z7T0_9PEZI|nr:COP9 CSN3 signalosome subunit 3 [Lecanosticta acicola]
MAELMARLLAFPPDKKNISPKEYDTKAREYVKDLWKLSEKDLNKEVDKKNVLELLNPAVNSIAYAAALYIQLDLNSKNKQKSAQLTELLAIFLSEFDPIQVRFIGETWHSLFLTAANAVEQGAFDFSLLVSALLRLDPTAGTFTDLHLELVRLALAKGVSSQVLPILDKDIYAFPQKSVKNVQEDFLSEEHEFSNAYITEKSGFTDKLSSDNVLEYYLLGAHIYIGRRDFSRARLFLEYVLLSPTQAHSASALQVEAYKKWVLIGLLSEGRPLPLPKTFDQVIVKNIRALAKMYDSLADSFEKRDYRKFEAEMQMGEAVWEDDGNIRLVTEASSALLRFRVIDLQKTYAALPVSRVSHLIDLPADTTAQLLTDMISRGYLNASIASSGAGAVLRFHDTLSYPTAAVDGDLESHTARVQALVGFVRDADYRLQLTKEYVDTMKRAKRQGPDSDLAEAMDLSWEQPMVPDDEDGDEDIMGP